MKGWIELIKISIRLVLCFIILSLVFCGGGADVGNPGYITGRVYNNDGTPVYNAMIVLGMEGASFNTDTQIINDSSGLIIRIRPIEFDTTYSDSSGKFTFENTEPGEYVVVASKGPKLGIEKVPYSSDGYSEVNVKVGTAADFQIQSRSLPGNAALSFVAAQISGTNYNVKPDSSGVFHFNSVPSGVLDIVLLRSNESIVTFKQFITDSSCNAVLVADPNRPTDYWTPKDCGYRDYQGRPYILYSSPYSSSTGDEAKANGGQPYDVHIQFSHAMDTRLTSQALTAFSSDNNISLDSLWWRGDDEVFIAFCSKDSSGNCSRISDYFRKGVKYSVVIDTTAQTIAGVKFANPDTIWFVPEP
jgi:hypothetical protein